MDGNDAKTKTFYEFHGVLSRCLITGIQLQNVIKVNFLRINKTSNFQIMPEHISFMYQNNFKHQTNCRHVSI